MHEVVEKRRAQSCFTKRMWSNLSSKRLHLVLGLGLLVVLANDSQNVRAENVVVKLDLTSTTLAPISAIAADAVSDAIKMQASSSADSATASTSADLRGGDAAASTTVAPMVVTASETSALPAITEANVTAAAAVMRSSTVKPIGQDVSPSKKLDQYFEPICEQLEKLNPKQMFKIQAQTKKFVELTNGKLGFCFAQQFSIEPSLKPVTKNELRVICAARTEPASSHKVQFKAFESCAAQHWEPSLDKELDRISVARSNCAKNHQHAKNDSSVAVTHEDNDGDEVSEIGDVVTKVLGDNKGAVNNSNIKLIDVSASTLAKTTSAPLVAAAATTITPTAPPVNVNVAVNLVSSTSAPRPSTGPVLSTVAPTVVGLVVGTNATSSTAHPLDSSTASPKVSATIMATPLSPAPTKKILNDPNTVVIFVDESGKKANNSSLSTSAPTSLGARLLAGSTTTTVTPKSDQDLQKKKDDLDAKKAIEALKLQRAHGHGSTADERMHQIEHERQMSLDPIGHTIKHKIYEMKKAAGLKQ